MYAPGSHFGTGITNDTLLSASLFHSQQHIEVQVASSGVVRVGEGNKVGTGKNKEGWGLALVLLGFLCALAQSVVESYPG